MEKTVEHLEAMFQKTESNVNYLTRKLEFEFENLEDAQVNPSRMLSKINDVKKEYSELVNEAAAIQEAQKEAVEMFQSQLTATYQLLQKFQDGTGTQPGEKPEELVKLGELLGIELPPSLRASNGTESGVSAGSATVEKTVTETAPKMNETGDSAASSSKESSLCPSARRAECSDFLDVSKEEFESVSDLIRGRVKLEEINKTYRILWRHFKEENKTKALTPQDMQTLGMRVTGTTGQAKLKVLRSLKLLKMSPKGDVTLT